MFFCQLHVRAQPKNRITLSKRLKGDEMSRQGVNGKIFCGLRQSLTMKRYRLKCILCSEEVLAVSWRGLQDSDPQTSPSTIRMDGEGCS